MLTLSYCDFGFKKLSVFHHCTHMADSEILLFIEAHWIDTVVFFLSDKTTHMRNCSVF